MFAQRGGADTAKGSLSTRQVKTASNGRNVPEQGCFQRAKKFVMRGVCVCLVAQKEFRFPSNADKRVTENVQNQNCWAWIQYVE